MVHALIEGHAKELFERYARKKVIVLRPCVGDEKGKVSAQ